MEVINAGINPGVAFMDIYEKLITSNAHILIAGATGSGKSVLINGFIKRAPQFEYILVDPKRVELIEYRRQRNAIFYADNQRGYTAALNAGIAIIEKRLRSMQRKRIKTYTGNILYIVVDECADLIQTDKAYTEKIIKIAQLGRAARVFLMLATQRATASVISGSIKVNCDFRVALHVPTVQDSRNIIGTGGAEKLPRYGKALLYSPDGITNEVVNL